LPNCQAHKCICRAESGTERRAGELGSSVLAFCFHLITETVSGRQRPHLTTTPPLTHLVMRYKASRTSSFNCTRTVPPTPTPSYAPMPTRRRDLPPHRRGTVNLNDSSAISLACACRTLKPPDGNPVGLTSDRHCRLAPVLSQ